MRREVMKSSHPEAYFIETSPTQFPPPETGSISTFSDKKIVEHSSSCPPFVFHRLSYQGLNLVNWIEFLKIYSSSSPNRSPYQFDQLVGHTSAPWMRIRASECFYPSLNWSRIFLPTPTFLSSSGLIFWMSRHLSRYCISPKYNNIRKIGERTTRSKLLRVHKFSEEKFSGGKFSLFEEAVALEKILLLVKLVAYVYKCKE